MRLVERALGKPQLGKQSRKGIHARLSAEHASAPFTVAGNGMSASRREVRSSAFRTRHVVRPADPPACY